MRRSGLLCYCLLPAVLLQACTVDLLQQPASSDIDVDVVQVAVEPAAPGGSITAPVAVPGTEAATESPLLSSALPPVGDLAVAADTLPYPGLSSLEADRLDALLPALPIIPADLEPVPELLSSESIVAMDELCREIGGTLGSVTVDDCMAQSLRFGDGWSVQSRPLSQRDFPPLQGRRARARVLVLGGIHGDEYSSVSIMFKWMEQLGAGEDANFYWRFLPLVNPDGLLEGEAVRQNANGVDLNRNFPTQDWEDQALDSWKHKTGRNPRRYPGNAPGSEPEVSWVVEQIRYFKPDVIVSVHAPYHLLDFDGPSIAPEKIGELHLHQLGVYPGSLGNYGGLELEIPVVTMELPSAGIMPDAMQVTAMWQDLLDWLQQDAVPYLDESRAFSRVD